jgi:hypothetical protein
VRIVEPMFDIVAFVTDTAFDMYEASGPFAPIIIMAEACPAMMVFIPRVSSGMFIGDCRCWMFTSIVAGKIENPKNPKTSKAGVVVATPAFYPLERF